MKKAILIMGVVLTAGFTYAQTILSIPLDPSEVPAAVKTKFSTLYPNTKVEKWEKEDQNFEAQFNMNKKEMTAVFDPTAKLVQTEESISKSELPKGVKEYVEKNYKGMMMSEPAKITDPMGGKTYEVEVNETYLIFDTKGNFMKSKKENETEGLKKIMKKKK